MNLEDAYPGDDVVDIVGRDFYWNTQGDPKDPVRGEGARGPRHFQGVEATH